MKELHIPYGIDRLTREIIEPEDSVSGRKCNCLCPGCEAPLVSRHPQRDDRRIHFAHDSKHQDAKPLEDCPLSPEVALAMVARHIAKGLAGKEIQLNEFEKYLSHSCCSRSTPTEIAPKQSAIIKNAEQSVSLGGANYDLQLTINGKSYFIDIFYAGKPKKDRPADEHLLAIGGILSLAAGAYLAMMMDEEFNRMRYGDSVEHFLLKDGAFDWEYHYLEAEKIAEARQLHKCPPPLSAQLFGHRQGNAYSNSHVSYSPLPSYGINPNSDYVVKCFYCAQPMTTKSIKPQAMGYKCDLCRKHNRQAPNPNSPITKESNHKANQAAEGSANSAEAYRKASSGEGGGSRYIAPPTPINNNTASQVSRGHSSQYHPQKHVRDADHNSNRPQPRTDIARSFRCDRCTRIYKVEPNAQPICPECKTADRG